MDVSECPNYDWSAENQQVSVMQVSDGALHDTTCSSCVDGVVQRGDFTQFEIPGANIVGTLPWNVDAAFIKTRLQTSYGQFVEVTRTVLDKYGSIEWIITFTGNPGMTPPGTGDINLLIVVQAVDTGGTLHDVSVREVRKGSTGLSGSFLIISGYLSEIVTITSIA